MTSYVNLIAKKLSGEINREEAQSLQAWLDLSSENELLFYRLKDAWHKGKYTPTIQNQEQTFEKIAAQLGLDQKESVLIPREHGDGFWHYGRRVAAVILLVLGATLSFVWYNDHPGADKPAENAQAAIISKRTPRGQKSLITLPDGSRVKLNAESYLEYSEDFVQSRQVKLVGEAFFEVVRDTLHPFVVTAGAVQIRVLGTSFNVQAFPFEENMAVAVASGAVWVEKKSKEYGRQASQLQPREMVEVNHKTGSIEKKNFDPNELLAWKDGLLLLQNASFDEIVQKLERWYGVDFIIHRTQPITDGFTGRYDNPSLEIVLEGMSFSSDFTYTLQDDKVIIE